MLIFLCVKRTHFRITNLARTRFPVFFAVLTYIVRIMDGLSIPTRPFTDVGADIWMYS